MNSQNATVGLMYFSPTGTTRKVCEEIAKTISNKDPERLDLTKPIQELGLADLWVVGVPVYASRVPTLANEKITQTLKKIPKNTPAIAVVVYGNVDVGAALKQLVELLSNGGLRVVGAGEFVGEHYFKKFHGLKVEGTVGRPDKNDLVAARAIGEAVVKKDLTVRIFLQFLLFNQPRYHCD